MSVLECDEVVREMSAYVDGELNVKRAAEMALHLVRCTSCRARYESESALVERLRGRSTPPAPKEVRRGIVERLLEEDRRDRGDEGPRS